MNQNLSKSKNLMQLIRQTIPTILMLFAFSTMLYAQKTRDKAINAFNGWRYCEKNVFRPTPAKSQTRLASGPVKGSNSPTTSKEMKSCR